MRISDCTRCITRMAIEGNEMVEIQHRSIGVGLELIEATTRCSGASQPAGFHG